MTYVATMDTEHFTFQAVGATRDEAIDALVQTMRRHRSNMGEAWEPEWYPHAADVDAPHPGEEGEPSLDYHWLRWLAEDWYAVRVSGPYRPGAPGTRDGSFITISEGD